MADLLTPTFFDDCEGIVSLNGHPFLKKEFALSDSKTVTHEQFCEEYGVSSRMLKDPKSWIGVWVKFEGVFLPVTVSAQTFDIPYSLLADSQGTFLGISVLNNGTVQITPYEE